MKFKIKQPLSRTPSKAIRQAVRDAKACEAHPKYMLNMNNWHLKRIAGIKEDLCQICLSGSVIARRTSVPSTQTSYPARFKAITHRLYGLNHFRVGCIEWGLLAFGIENEIAKEWGNREHPEPPPGNDFTPLFTALLTLAGDLEAEGL